MVLLKKKKKQIRVSRKSNLLVSFSSFFSFRIDLTTKLLVCWKSEEHFKSLTHAVIIFLGLFVGVFCNIMAKPCVYEKKLLCSLNKILISGLHLQGLVLKSKVSNTRLTAASTG